jgi:hypothetical protein
MLTKVSAFIFDNPTSFDATDSMFDADANFGHILVEPLLDFIQLPISRFFKRLYDKNIIWPKPLISAILKEMDAIWKNNLILVCDGLIMHSSLMSRA